MQVNDRVTVKQTAARGAGVILAVEVFNEGTMYLVSLEDYPAGVWFLMKSTAVTGRLWSHVASMGSNVG